jgi:hypothetical protein
MADESTLNFYVDGILSRTITGASISSWDTLVLGPGLGSTVGDAWSDGLTLAVPEPSTVVLGALGGLALLVGVIRRRA